MTVSPVCSDMNTTLIPTLALSRRARDQIIDHLIDRQTTRATAFPAPEVSTSLADRLAGGRAFEPGGHGHFTSTEARPTPSNGDVAHEQNKQGDDGQLKPRTRLMHRNRFWLFFSHLDTLSIDTSSAGPPGSLTPAHCTVRRRRDPRPVRLGARESQRAASR